MKSYEQEEPYPEFPGLTTMVRHHLILGIVNHGEEDPEMTPRLHVIAGKKELWNTDWKPLEQVPILAKYRNWIDGRAEKKKALGRKTSKVNKGVKARNSRLSLSGGQGNGDGPGAVLPWTETEVSTLLSQQNVDASSFGMSLSELSAKASEGSLYFAKNAEGDLVCAVDTVMLRILSVGGGAVLVKVPGGDEDDNSLTGLEWPKDKRRYGESLWETARRQLRNVFQIQDECMNVCHWPLDVPGTAPKSGVWERRWVISAQINDGMQQNTSAIHGGTIAL